MNYFNDPYSWATNRTWWRRAAIFIRRATLLPIEAYLMMA